MPAAKYPNARDRNKRHVTDWGRPGTSVFINGTGFTGTSEVTFPTGAVKPIDFTVNFFCQIIVVVPANGATGAIGITAPRDTTDSPTLFYVQQGMAETAPVQAAPTSTRLVIAPSRLPTRRIRSKERRAGY